MPDDPIFPPSAFSRDTAAIDAAMRGERGERGEEAK